ncbi:MAG TPA: SGNH/GDSL hydrolase family protein [Clostridium sp.]
MSYKRKSNSKFIIIGTLTVAVLIIMLGIGIYRNNQLLKTNAQEANIYNNKQAVKDSIAQKKADIEQKKSDKYKDKKWYADGDSMTEQNIYPYYLKDMCGFAKYYNAGRSGQGMARMADKFAVEPLTNYDLITVFAGTNDYGGSTPLGTIYDSEYAKTFYGYTKMVIGKIRKSNPKIEIVFFTPLKRGKFENQPIYPAPNEIGVQLENYVQAIKDVCNKDSIKVIDLFNESGINENNLLKYTKDGLHPNEAGCKKIDVVIQTGLEN